MGDEASNETMRLLLDWREGNDRALNDLLSRHLPAIRGLVEARLGKPLRKKAEREDIVQEAMIDLLRYLPQFRISKESSFRAFFAKIVINVIRDQSDWYTALRRKVSMEVPIPSDIVLDLDPPKDEVATPSRLAQTREDVAWVRLALTLVDTADRDVIALRDWKELSFVEAGVVLGISEDAARKRYLRALMRLSTQVTALQRRGVEGSIDPIV